MQNKHAFTAESQEIKCECGGTFKVVSIVVGTGTAERLECKQCGKNVYAGMLLHIAEKMLKALKINLEAKHD